jgi:excisionase family DNA binding protein
MDTEQTKWLGTREAAKEMGISQDTVQIMLRKGELPGTRVRHQWKILRADIEAYLEEHRNVRGTGALAVVTSSPQNVS